MSAKERQQLLNRVDFLLERVIFPNEKEKLDETVRKDILRPRLPYFSPSFVLCDDISEPEDDLCFLGPEDMDDPGIFREINSSLCTLEDGWLRLFKLKSVPAKYFRGRPVKPLPRLAALGICFLHPDKPMVSLELAMAWVNHRWVNAENNRHDWHGDNPIQNSDDLKKRKTLDEITRMLISTQLSLRYEWCVTFRLDNSPAIKFATDPSGLKDLFKDRDKDFDKDRKTALRNWVMQHWRKKRNDEEASIFVRRHLRGKIPFRWNGYDCVIEPSELDLELNKNLAQDSQLVTAG